MDPPWRLETRFLQLSPVSCKGLASLAGVVRIGAANPVARTIVVEDGLDIEPSRVLVGYKASKEGGR